MGGKDFHTRKEFQTEILSEKKSHCGPPGPDGAGLGSEAASSAVLQPPEMMTCRGTRRKGKGQLWFRPRVSPKRLLGLEMGLWEVIRP